MKQKFHLDLNAAIGLPETGGPFLIADWPAPNNIKTLITTRKGGVSNGIFRFDYEFTPVPPLENLELAQHVTDTYIVNLVDKTVKFASDYQVTTV